MASLDAEKIIEAAVEEAMRHFAQKAYEGYCNHTGWKSLATGAELPIWNCLPKEIQEAWVASIRAVYEEADKHS